ncbi:histidine phosphatase family protein [Pseudonocardia bannensis]|uniref:Histidine phosphatase family protein n=1 Tax=Pseudonocardia bannensis TaxID=630973 RepID=A0A848DFF5_9PSEU|nr:histidine phosphatase family protein [Pseudonocardia bannensis]NMH91271.1 histidine phosphatase family protein [Pseudonocardia bannensis]
MSLRRLILLRHGQTDYNLAGRMQGHLDSKLTDEGRTQVARAAPELARFAPDRLISSDLSRAVHSADEVAAITGLPVELDPRLRETHLGQWQGRSVDEIEVDWPGAIATWRSDPTWAPPGGESRVEVVARSLPVVRELDVAYGDPRSDRQGPDGEGATALLVAHGGLIAGLVSGLLGLPEPAWPSIGGLGNARWAVLARRPDHPRWRLAGYNVGANG